MIRRLTAKPRLNPSEIGIVTAGRLGTDGRVFSSFGRWTPITLISSSSHSERSLPGGPDFDDSHLWDVAFRSQMRPMLSFRDLPNMKSSSTNGAGLRHHDTATPDESTTAA